MKQKIAVLLLLCAALAYVEAPAQSRYSWKEAQTELPSKPANNPKMNDGIEIYTRPGVIVINTPEKTTVTILTILGQTISTATILAGSYELNLRTKGIYIVKVGNHTVRVAI